MKCIVYKCDTCSTEITARDGRVPAGWFSCSLLVPATSTSGVRNKKTPHICGSCAVAIAQSNVATIKARQAAVAAERMTTQAEQSEALEGSEWGILGSLASETDEDEDIDDEDDEEYAEVLDDDIQRARRLAKKRHPIGGV